MKAKIIIFDDDGNEVDHFLNKPSKIFTEESAIKGHTQTRYRFAIDYVVIDGWKGGMFLKGDKNE